MGPKSHHVIPRLHLANFAGGEPRGQVWTYDGLNSKSWSAIPDETATQTHFYSVPGEDGTMDTRIETMLSEFESRAAPHYRTLLSGKFPADQGKMEFAEFLGLMFSRTTAMRRMHAEIMGRGIQIQQYATAMHDGAFSSLMRKMEKDHGPIAEAVKADVRKSMIDPSGHEIIVPQVSTLRALGVADKLAQLFFKMDWTLLFAESGFFITSDNPVVRRVDPKTWHPVFGDQGFLNQTAEVTFPLSPRLMLLMTWKKLPLRHAAIPRPVVEELNQSRAVHSDRYIYAHLHHKKLEKLSTKFADTRPKMTTQGLGPEKFAEVRVTRKGRLRRNDSKE